MKVNPFIVGHSFGGYVALETCYHFQEKIGGLLLMDFTTAPPEEYVEWGKRVEREGVKPGRTLRTYPTKEAAKERFRLLPDQPGVRQELLDHILGDNPSIAALLVAEARIIAWIEQQQV